jgi:hypothetical protein
LLIVLFGLTLLATPSLGAVIPDVIKGVVIPFLNGKKIKEKEVFEDDDNIKNKKIETRTKRNTTIETNKRNAKCYTTIEKLLMTLKQTKRLGKIAEEITQEFQEEFQTINADYDDAIGSIKKRYSL